MTGDLTGEHRHSGEGSKVEKKKKKKNGMKNGMHDALGALPPGSPGPRTAARGYAMRSEFKRRKRTSLFCPVPRSRLARGSPHLASIRRGYPEDGTEIWSGLGTLFRQDIFFTNHGATGAPVPERADGHGCMCVDGRSGWTRQPADHCDGAGEKGGQVSGAVGRLKGQPSLAPSAPVQAGVPATSRRKRPPAARQGRTGGAGATGRAGARQLLRLAGLSTAAPASGQRRDETPAEKAARDGQSARWHGSAHGGHGSTRRGRTAVPDETHTAEGDSLCVLLPSSALGPAGRTGVPCDWPDTGRPCNGSPLPPV